MEPLEERLDFASWLLFKLLSMQANTHPKLTDRQKQMATNASSFLSACKDLKDNKLSPGGRWHRQLTENIGMRALASRCYEIVGMARECRDMRELRDKVAHH